MKDTTDTEETRPLSTGTKNRSLTWSRPATLPFLSSLLLASVFFLAATTRTHWPLYLILVITVVVHMFFFRIFPTVYKRDRA